MPLFTEPLLRNIRNARKKAHLSQAELANELGVSTLHYGRLERGEQPISLARLVEIADLLDTTVYDLLDGAVPGDRPVSTMPKAMLHKIETDKLLDACSDESIRLIRDIAWLIASDYDI